MPKIIIRLENLLIFVLSIYFILNTPDNGFFIQNWYLIILIWLSFDLSMIGYLINKKLGSMTYNLIHNYLLAILIVVYGNYVGSPNLIILGLILISHISLDRFLGYGLKYPADFKHTHIQKL